MTDMPSDITSKAPSLESARLLRDAFEEISLSNIAREAVFCPHQAPSHFAQVSSPEGLRGRFGELRQAAQSLASCLNDQGFSNDHPIFIILDTRLEFVVIMLAILYLGGVHVPIDPQRLGFSGEIQHMVGRVLQAHPEKRPCVFALASDAEKVDSMKELSGCYKVLVGGERDGWTHYSALIQETDLRLAASNLAYPARAVFFTSGTTARPKACMIDMDAFLSSASSVMSWSRIGSGGRTAVLLPLHHMAGYLSTLGLLLHGSCVVFPGFKFDPLVASRTLSKAGCTHATLVATMAHALISCSPRRSIVSLKGLIFLGMSSEVSLLQQSMDHFDLSYVENMYGMSEGVCISTGAVTCPRGISGLASVGLPARGLRVRICDEEDNRVVSRGTAGQILVCGDSVISGYLGEPEAANFLHDGDDRWLITGDAGIIHTNGELHIVGRYKDMIVRGGKNIAPASIEVVLNENLALRPLQPQVVAKKDSIAGEVPVLIVLSEPQSDIIAEAFEVVRLSLGPSHVPVQTYDVSSLGLSSYPVTQSGKILKRELQDLVSRQVSAAHSDHSLTSPDLSSVVVETWAKSVGISAHELGLDRSMAHYADSILMLSVRDQIERKTGRQVALHNWLQARTIRDQIIQLELLDPLEERRLPISIDSGETAAQENDLSRGRGKKPPTNGDLDESSRSAVTSALHSCGLDWKDVEEIFYCADVLQIISRFQVVESWNVKTSFVAEGRTAREVRGALRNALARHPILFSCLVVDREALPAESGLHIILQQSDELTERLIHDSSPLKDLEELRSLTLSDFLRDDCQLSGPLFRAAIIPLPEMNSMAVIMNMSHAVLDKTSHQMFIEDFDRSLSGEATYPHKSYRIWSDHYHSGRSSDLALEAIDFHSSYLKDIKLHCHALWPHSTQSLEIDPTRLPHDGHFHQFAIPGLQRLIGAHPGLTPAAIVKAALTLLIISRTNHSHAFFVSLEAGRTSLPFLRTSDSGALDVNGPCLNASLNLVEFTPDEITIEFLYRTQAEQIQLSKHATVPWYEVFSRLDCDPTVFINATKSCIFNWMPGLGAWVGGKNHLTSLKVEQIHLRTSIGLNVNSGLTGDGNSLIFLFQGAIANRSSLWINRIATELQHICLWLVTEDSLQLPVERFMDSFASI